MYQNIYGNNYFFKYIKTHTHYLLLQFVVLSWSFKKQFNATLIHFTMGTSISNLAFDELSYWSLSQLRRGAFRDVKRRCNHLASGSVHTDKMDEAREILQVSEISQVKVSTLRSTVCFTFISFLTGCIGFQRPL